MNQKEKKEQCRICNSDHVYVIYLWYGAVRYVTKSVRCLIRIFCLMRCLLQINAVFCLEVCRCTDRTRIWEIRLMKQVLDISIFLYIMKGIFEIFLAVLVIIYYGNIHILWQCFLLYPLLWCNSILCSKYVYLQRRLCKNYDWKIGSSPSEQGPSSCVSAKY